MKQKITSFFLSGLFVCGSLIAASSQEKESPFMEAIKQENLEKVEQLIKEGYDVNEYYTSITGPLAQAADQVNIPIMKALLQAGANPNEYKGPNYSIPVFIYVLDGIRHSNDPRASHITDDTIVEAFKLLIAHGADVNAPFYQCEKFEKNSHYSLHMSRNLMFMCIKEGEKLTLLQTLELAQKRGEKPELIKKLMTVLQEAGAR